DRLAEYVLIAHPVDPVAVDGRAGRRSRPAVYDEMGGGLGQVALEQSVLIDPSDVGSTDCQTRGVVAPLFEHGRRRAAVARRIAGEDERVVEDLAPVVGEHYV